MLSFADNGWHVISNMLLFTAGLWFIVAQRRVFGVSIHHAALLYAWHTFFCLFYFTYSLSNAADSTLYYTVSTDYDSGFGFGTKGIYFLTSIFTQGLLLSYGGTFLVFNLFGYCGMIAAYSAYRYVTKDQNQLLRRTILITILLPGLSFWSSNIGKDALTFMGTGLALWAGLDASRRYPTLILSVAIFLLARPHIAAILLASISFAIIFSSRLGIVKKLLLLLPLLPAAAAGVVFALRFIGLEEASGVSDIAEYVEDRQGHNLSGGSSVDIASMPIPLRLFTYLFRPLIFDANGALGLILSVENLIILSVFLWAFWAFLRGRRSNLNRFSFVLFLVFSVISWFILANTTANLGIAARQKWMFLPMLLMIAFSYLVKTRKTYTRIEGMKSSGEK